MAKTPLGVVFALVLESCVGLVGCRDGGGKSNSEGTDSNRPPDMAAGATAPRGNNTENTLANATPTSCKEYLEQAKQVMSTLADPVFSTTRPLENGLKKLLEGGHPKVIRRTMTTFTSPPPSAEGRRLHRELLAAFYDMAETIEQAPSRNADDSAMRIDNTLGNIRQTLSRIEAMCAQISP